MMFWIDGEPMDAGNAIARMKYALQYRREWMGGRMDVDKVGISEWMNAGGKIVQTNFQNNKSNYSFRTVVSVTYSII